MHGAWTVELVTVAVSRSESNFVENLLHGDLSAKYVEVNTWHDHLLLGKRGSSLMEQRRGTGTSELSRRGLFFTLAVDKPHSLNDVWNQLGTVQESPPLFGWLTGPQCCFLNQARPCPASCAIPKISYSRQSGVSVLPYGLRRNLCPMVRGPAVVSSQQSSLGDSGGQSLHGDQGGVVFQNQQTPWALGWELS